MHMNYHMYEIPNTPPNCPPEGHYIKVYGNPKSYQTKNRISISLPFQNF